MSEASGERTQQPTARRRQQLWQRGLIARSPELNAAGVLLGGGLALFLFGDDLVAALAALAVHGLAEAPAPDGDARRLVEQITAVLCTTLAAVVPLLLTPALVALAVNWFQVGIVFNPSLLAPRSARVSPGQRLAQLLSARNVLDLLHRLLKLVVVAAAFVWLVHGRLPDLYALSGLSVEQIASYTCNSLRSVGLMLGAILGVLAIADYAMRRWRQERQVRMTAREFHEELREMEGDPQLHRRRRLLQRGLRSRRAPGPTAGSDA